MRESKESVGKGREKSMIFLCIEERRECKGSVKEGQSQSDGTETHTGMKQAGTERGESVNQGWIRGNPLSRDV